MRARDRLWDRPDRHPFRAPCIRRPRRELRPPGRRQSRLPRPSPALRPAHGAAGRRPRAAPARPRLRHGRVHGRAARGRPGGRDHRRRRVGRDAERRAGQDVAEVRDLRARQRDEPRGSGGDRLVRRHPRRLPAAQPARAGHRAALVPQLPQAGRAARRARLLGARLRAQQADLDPRLLDDHHPDGPPAHRLQRALPVSVAQRAAVRRGRSGWRSGCATQGSSTSGARRWAAGSRTSCTRSWAGARPRRRSRRCRRRWPIWRRRRRAFGSATHPRAGVGRDVQGAACVARRAYRRSA